MTYEDALAIAQAIVDSLKGTDLGYMGTNLGGALMVLDELQDALDADEPEPSRG